VRILQACPYSWHAHGGVQEHIAQVSRALRLRGHTVRIVAPGDCRRPVDDGVAVVGRAMRIPYNGSVAPSCIERAAIARVRRHLAEFAPDVVHTHEPFSSFVTGAAAVHARTPVVATFHCAVDGWGDRLLYRGVTRALWWVDRTVDVRLAVSASAADTLRLATSRPIDIVPNGVELERFAALAAAPLPVDGPVLFVGRLEPRKGLATLLEAVERLARRGTAVPLTIVGDGPDRDLIERLTPAVRPLVDLHGHCSRDALLRHYAAARVFVAPSIGGESFGMALLDALAAGRPVVASDIAAYRELLEEGRAGLLATPGDAGALAARLAWLLDHPAESAALGQAAAARAQRYSWDTIAARLETLYGAALDGSVGRQRAHELVKTRRHVPPREGRVDARRGGGAEPRRVGPVAEQP
jgi:phosphatidylinositol alpha-mannosyltransferase